MDEVSQTTQVEQQNPQSKPLTAWVVLVAVILTAVIVGGLMVWWKNNSEQELKKQLEVLQSASLPVAGNDEVSTSDNTVQSTTLSENLTPPNVQRPAPRQNWYIYASDKYNYQFEYPLLAGVSTGGKSLTGDDLWECTGVVYPANRATQGYIRIAAPNSTVSCGSPVFELRATPATEVITIEDKQYTASGFTYHKGGRVVGESYSFSPGGGIAINYAVKTMGDAIAKESDYSDIKETIVAILESYKSTNVLPSPLPWITLHNKNGYEIQYPANMPAGTNDYGGFDTRETETVLVRGVEINALSPIGKCAGVESNNIGVQKYAQKIWEINKSDSNLNISDKKVGELEQTKLDGIPAYQFTVTGSFASACGGYVLDKEHKFIYAESNGQIFEISLPTGESTLDAILRTFKWY